MKKIMKIALKSSVFCVALSLSGATLDSGLHMFVANSDENLSVGDYTGDIDVLYSISDSRTGYKSFLPSNTLSFLNSLQGVNADTGYLVKVSTDNVTLPNYKSLTPISESDVILYKGLNIINLPVMATIELGMHYINGAKIDVIYAVSDSRTGYKSYLPSNTLSFLNSLGSTKSDVVYLVRATGEINDVYITSALTSDADLTSLATENLNSKSIVVMENDNNTSVKTSLITFKSDNTYKSVELSNFTPSSLSSNDSDINSTISTEVTSMTSGICGNWNFNTSLNMTPIDSSGNPESNSQAVIAETSDGNFTTVVGSTSTFKKVVWYGTAISLDNITDCTLNGLPSAYNTCVNGTDTTMPQIPSSCTQYLD